jgi:hypothetical protein
MFTALTATSLSVAALVRAHLEADMAAFFDSAAGGSMVVSLSTPQEMTALGVDGLSVWLYRAVRDPERVNAPPEWTDDDELARPPLPLRLHYLMAPIIAGNSPSTAQTRQSVLGNVLQTVYDSPTLLGPSLQGDLAGTDTEIRLRLEQLTLEEITRVWHALDRSYELSVSYEASVIPIASRRQPVVPGSVTVSLPEHGIVVAGAPA